MDASNLIRMANRIGQFFEAMPDREEALDGSRAGVHGRFLAHRQSGRGPVHAEDMPRRVIVSLIATT